MPYSGSTTNHRILTRVSQEGDDVALVVADTEAVGKQGTPAPGRLSTHVTVMSGTPPLAWVGHVKAYTPKLKVRLPRLCKR